MTFDLKEFRTTNNFSALKIATTSLVPFFLIVVLSFYLYDVSYYWVLGLAVPAHWFHSRVFIVMHDSGHQSFAKNNFLNEVLGHLAGLCFFTPFLMWRQLHNRHHKYQGNLDKRGESLDVWMMTADEYQKSSVFQKFIYRYYRNPFVFFIFGPFVLFLGAFRFPFESFNKKISANIILLNIFFITSGIWFYNMDMLLKLVLVLLPVITLSFVLAVILFYAQHQFEDTVWFDDANYDFSAVGIRGSSYIQMPAFLNWWTGAIGYHHVHHLDVKIPMYQLASAHHHLATHASVTALPWTSLGKITRLKLWDVKAKKMIPFTE